MTEAEWLACEDQDRMLTAHGQSASLRKRRLLAIATLRRNGHPLPDDLREAISALEIFMDRPGNELANWARIAGLSGQRPDPLAGLAHLPTDQAIVFDIPGRTGPASWIQTAGVEEICQLFAVAFRETRDPTAVNRAPPGGEIQAAREAWKARLAAEEAERRRQCGLLRDILGNPFRPVGGRLPDTLTSGLTQLADAAYDNRELPSGHLDPARLAVLSDALQEAGCTDADLLSHLRSPGPHVRGCWAVDLVLCKS